MLQAPDRFVAAAVRNPACNLALMVGTTDIPDWCYVEACGSKGKDIFSEAPSADYLTLFHSKSPISHLSKVCLKEALFLINIFRSLMADFHKSTLECKNNSTD